MLFVVRWCDEMMMMMMMMVPWMRWRGCPQLMVGCQHECVGNIGDQMMIGGMRITPSAPGLHGGRHDIFSLDHRTVDRSLQFFWYLCSGRLWRLTWLSYCPAGFLLSLECPQCWVPLCQFRHHQWFLPGPLQLFLHSVKKNIIFQGSFIISKLDGFQLSHHFDISSNSI